MKTDMIQEQQKAQQTIQEQGKRILVCAGTGCVACGAYDLIKKFEEYGAQVTTLSSQEKVTIVPTGCHGFCQQGVLVVIPSLNVNYVKVQLEDVPEIMKALEKGEVVDRLLYVDPQTQAKVPHPADINFYAKQTKMLY